MPEDKVISRYSRSLDLLTQAVRLTNRAYLFDNSSHQHVWIAEITDGSLLEMKTDPMPAWFKKSFLDKVNSLKNKSDNG